ncbi:hypothetical protein HYH03_012334 [Edaphochlamys debaryana]|uniref:Uncharacterized protein n=1 Tax=Edaphochlamys debaryana TaxID=47281 RepID=A0A835XRX0_9CHLO|nr:hypothetical protein HYH03_012334 [Edaphochlamys debaryana]|eukprot:KAG2489108.1 hypothetical protein HYH03_012334 [Edaphochlamys debaryana]
MLHMSSGPHARASATLACLVFSLGGVRASGLSNGEVVAVAVCSAVGGVILLVVLLWCCCRRRQTGDISWTKGPRSDVEARGDAGPHVALPDCPRGPEAAGYSASTAAVDSQYHGANASEKSVLMPLNMAQLAIANANAELTEGGLPKTGSGRSRHGSGVNLAQLMLHKAWSAPRGLGEPDVGGDSHSEGDAGLAKSSSMRGGAGGPNSGGLQKAYSIGRPASLADGAAAGSEAGGIQLSKMGSARSRGSSVANYLTRAMGLATPRSGRSVTSNKEKHLEVSRSARVEPSADVELPVPFEPAATNAPGPPISKSSMLMRWLHSADDDPAVEQLAAQLAAAGGGSHSTSASGASGSLAPASRKGSKLLGARRSVADSFRSARSLLSDRLPLLSLAAQQSGIVFSKMPASRSGTPAVSVTEVSSTRHMLKGTMRRSDALSVTGDQDVADGGDHGPAAHYPPSLARLSVTSQLSGLAADQQAQILSSVRSGIVFDLLPPSNPVSLNTSRAGTSGGAPPGHGPAPASGGASYVYDATPRWGQTDVPAAAALQLQQQQAQAQLEHQWAQVQGQGQYTPPLPVSEGASVASTLPPMPLPPLLHSPPTLRPGAEPAQLSSPVLWLHQVPPTQLSTLKEALREGEDASPAPSTKPSSGGAAEQVATWTKFSDGGSSTQGTFLPGPPEADMGASASGAASASASAGGAPPPAPAPALSARVAAVMQGLDNDLIRQVSYDDAPPPSVTFGGGGSDAPFVPEVSPMLPSPPDLHSPPSLAPSLAPSPPKLPPQPPASSSPHAAVPPAIAAARAAAGSRTDSPVPASPSLGVHFPPTDVADASPSLGVHYPQLPDGHGSSGGRRVAASTAELESERGSGVTVEVQGVAAKRALFEAQKVASAASATASAVLATSGMAGYKGGADVARAAEARLVPDLL